MIKKRIEYIDLAKGICILFVVLWHCVQFSNIGNFPLNRIMMSFRMPLYFVLSGLFFKQYGGFCGFLTKKTNKLLVPFFFFYVFTCMIIPIVSLLHNGNTDISRYIDIFLGWYFESFRNLAIWFLLCLFNCNVIFFVLEFMSNRLPRYNVFVLIFLSIVVGIIGIYLGKNKINFPMFLDSSMTCIPFFCLGYVLRNYTSILYINRYDKFNIPFCLILFVTLLLLTKDLGVVGYMSNTMQESIFVIYGSGMVGSIFILILCKQIVRIPFISYIGRYSIMILLTHYFIISYISIFLAKYISNSLVLCSCTFIFTITICSILIPLFKEYIPKFTAQRDLIQ